MTEIPGDLFAIAIHEGPDARIDETYAAVGSYVADRGIGAEGPVRERYLAGVLDDPAPADHRNRLARDRAQLAVPGCSGLPRGWCGPETQDLHGRVARTVPAMNVNQASGKAPVDSGHPQVVIYTDGACKGNPGPGGWGAWLSSGGHEKELSGGDPQTTNQRMELTAAIEALSALTKPCSVVLYSDSKYVLEGITKWIHGWKRNGWKNSAKQAVKNADLWQRLDEESARHQIEWRWVKGHSGDVGNERADALANAGAALFTTSQQ